MTAAPSGGQFGPEVYRAWRRSSLGEITEALELRVILELAGRVRELAVLDIGCGDGTLALALMQHGASRASGCDPDPRMIARARSQAPCCARSIDFVVARSQALPYADQSFDVVTCITVLSFVSDPTVAIREMVRVLRPGGRLIVGDLGKWSFWAVRRRIRGWFGTTLWRAARFRTANELAIMLRSAGLRVDAIRGAIFFPPWAALAHLIALFDLSLGHVTTLGAAFVALLATKE
jgi:SAM-dependent methyltransferase